MLVGRYTSHALPEGVLGGQKMQPYIHDCHATYVTGDKDYKYRIFYKRHAKLPVNIGLQTTIHRGDIVIMRLSPLSDSRFVNMRGGDSRRMDDIVRQSDTIHFNLTGTPLTLIILRFVEYLAERRERNPKARTPKEELVFHA